MAIVKKEVKIADQLADVMALVHGIVEPVKNKGDYTSLVDELIAAITGVDEIPAEVKEDLQACINTVTLSATDIAFLFVKKDEVAE